MPAGDETPESMDVLNVQTDSDGTDSNGLAEGLDGKVATIGDERSLLPRHCNGDGTAFPKLVELYRRRIYSYLVRSGIQQQARDDIFQEVFLKVHHARLTYQPHLPLSPWIYTIAINTVRDHFRKNRTVHNSSLHSPIDDEQPNEEEAPFHAHDLSEARETLAWLEAELHDLPPQQREVIMLVCIEQMEQQDAAKLLGIPLNTVKTHLRRARMRLAKALARRNATLRRESSR